MPRATTLHVRGQVLQVMFDGVIRTCQVNQIMFVGKDVATALGYSKPLNAISMHVDEDDKTTTLIQGTGSNYMLPKLETKGCEWGRLST